MARFADQCHALCDKILQLFGVALEIPSSEGGADWFSQRHDRAKGPSGSVLRLLYVRNIPNQQPLEPLITRLANAPNTVPLHPLAPRPNRHPRRRPLRLRQRDAALPAALAAGP